MDGTEDGRGGDRSRERYPEGRVRGAGRVGGADGDAGSADEGGYSRDRDDGGAGNHQGAPTDDTPATAGRTLEELGLAVVPRDDPLAYPGVWPAESALLVGDRLLPLTRLVHEDRVPVLAVGSNASPGQLRAKLAESALTTPLPLVKVRVTGLDIGVSAHISRMGYVSASPFVAPGAVRELFVTWLDAGQLAAVDASEGATLAQGNYRRVWLPARDVRIDLADGRTLPGAYVYVNRRGVLHDGGGTLLRHCDQRALLGALLAGLPRLRKLCGATPEEFCARVRADPAVGRRGTRLFAEEGLVAASGLEGFGSGPAQGEARWHEAP
ncbi:hypothetical protein AB0D49_23500 [Streptomyces sp. NPDC048290]|uniref:hypothetical protein n=1 Tax=Streptomyces sp. NPDC048290 TaxID=3155811 RepID=UPI003449031A